MDEREYQHATTRLRTLWPSLAAWFNGLEAQSQQGIRERWRSCLMSCEASDVEVAMTAMSTEPDDPWPYPADKERAAAILAKRANERKTRRSESSGPAPQRSARGEYRSLGIMSRVTAAIEADSRHSAECLEHRRVYGRCLPECPVRSLVGRELASEDVGLEPDGQRFSCHLCRDTGFVSCLRSADVASTIRDGRVPAVRGTYSVACECSKGLERDAQSQRDGRRLMERYNPVRDVRVDAPDDEIVTTCRALAESGGGRRVAAFDEFNAGRRTA